MSVLSLYVHPEEVLRQAASPVEYFNRDVRRLAQDMIETMYDNDGIGLAAPQVGKSVQLFVANPSRKRGRELIVANPIMEALRGRASIVEGCLSLPHVWERVKRAAHVRLSGQDLKGKPIVIEAQGLLAIVLQHEADHLQGRLFLDRLPWIRRHFVRPRRKG